MSKGYAMRNGGTSLALQYGHSRSVGLDFFGETASSKITKK